MMMQTLTPDFGHANEMFSKAMSFDLSDVTSRYTKDHNISQELARLHELECRRYLLLCALFPDEKLGMTGPVDSYWHTFLLFTKQYARFCGQVGQSFIHHFPADAKQVPDNSFGNTMQRYRLVFGLEPNVQAWPSFAEGADCTECSTGPGPGDCTPIPSCSNEPAPK